MAYSVSPRRMRPISGGKNSEKRSTRIPTALAAAKWPASCRTTRAAKPRKASSQLTLPAPRARGGAAGPCRCGRPSRAHRLFDQLAPQRARFSLGHVEPLEVVQAGGAELVEHPGDDRRDAGEAQPAGEEGVDRDLVGGVEGARRRPTRQRGLARQAQA